MSLLDIRGVSKSFGPVGVLHGVDLTVDRGEVVGLVGDNGAGKSTLMKIVTGLYTADEGSITLDGAPILGLTPGQRRSLVSSIFGRVIVVTSSTDTLVNSPFSSRDFTTA